MTSGIRGSIKDTVSLKHREAEAEEEAERKTALEGRRSVVIPTSDVTPTAPDLLVGLYHFS